VCVRARVRACVSQTFDLKGSLRARYVEVADPQANDQVLLDENLLECALVCARARVRVRWCVRVC